MVRKTKAARTGRSRSRQLWHVPPQSRKFGGNAHRQVVITGGPSVGKSSMIALLRYLGFPVGMEQAVKVLNDGRTPHPTVDRHAFQIEVLRRQKNAERRKRRHRGICFFDRGVFDGVAYYICDGLEPPKQFIKLQGRRYSLVLLLEPLSAWSDDGQRFEDLAFTHRITPVLEQLYAERGVLVVRVPALPPIERLNFILEAIGCDPVVVDEALLRQLRRLGLKT